METQNANMIIEDLKKFCMARPITLISGSFDPFNEYYFDLLRWASRQRNPLVVIVQSDKMVSLRRGFKMPLIKDKKRIEIIKSLKFVKKAVLADCTAHDESILTLLKPECVVFQNDNKEYREVLKKRINKTFPKIRVEIAPINLADYKIVKKISLSSERDKFIEALTKKAMTSRGVISRISAILVDKKGQIVLTASNSNKEEHAEIILLKKAYEKSLSVQEYSIITLIPPCLLCARNIFRSGVKKVSFLFPYGDGKGIQYLESKNIEISIYN